MKARELKSLLRVLRTAGVSKFEDGPLKIALRAPSRPEGDAQVAATGDAGDDQMELPEGVYDPVGHLTKLNRKRAERS